MKVFIEEQRFDQWLFRLLMLAAIAVIIGTVVMAFPEIRSDITAFAVIILVSIISLLLILTLLFSIKLETKIDEYGIHYGFRPFHLRSKVVSWREMSSCSVERYNPIADFSGWGYRVFSFRKKGVAVNVKGNIGIQIVFKNGKKLLLGTQKEDEAKKALESYESKFENL